MALLPKSKIGVAVGWQTKRGARKSNEDTKTQETVDSTVATTENGDHVEGEVPHTRKRGTRSSEEGTNIPEQNENVANNDKGEEKSPLSKKSASVASASSTNEESSTETAGGGRPKRTRR